MTSLIKHLVLQDISNRKIQEDGENAGMMYSSFTAHPLNWYLL